MDIQKNSFLSIEQLTDRYLTGARQNQDAQNAKGLSFQEILQSREAEQSSRSETLKFSRHAANRLAERNIELSDTQMERLEGGVDRAGGKGIKDSLVIVDDLAFIVNVPNKTVVTAMDSTATEDKIFTNINGAVIM